MFAVHFCLLREFHILSLERSPPSVAMPSSRTTTSFTTKGMWHRYINIKAEITMQMKAIVQYFHVALIVFSNLGVIQYLGVKH